MIRALITDTVDEKTDIKGIVLYRITQGDGLETGVIREADAEFYKEAIWSILEENGLLPSECLAASRRPALVLAGRELSMHGIVYQDVQEIEDRIRVLDELYQNTGMCYCAE